ncbi:MAG: ribonuclease P protein component [Chlamydiae bacterium]|nr:ribonuclease P protein component [Chlamydiota bacterium]
MWIPQKNEDSQGSTSSEPQKKSGEKETHNCIASCSFPKTHRILSRRSFQKTRTHGSRFQSGLLVFWYCRTPSFTKVGLTVSKKYGKAHERNYFKRVVREVFRENKSLLPSGTVFIVSPTAPCPTLSKQQVKEDFLSFVSHLRSPACYPP